MAAYLTGLQAVWSFLLTTLDSIFELYTTVPILVSVLGLWVLDRVFGIFNLIKG